MQHFTFYSFVDVFRNLHASSASLTGGGAQLGEFVSTIKSGYGVAQVPAKESDHPTNDGPKSTASGQSTSSSKSWSEMLNHGVNTVVQSGFLSQKGNEGLTQFASTAKAVSASGGVRTLAADFVDRTLKSDSAADSAASIPRESSSEVKSASKWSVVRNLFGSKTKRNDLKHVADLAMKSNKISSHTKDVLTVSRG